MKNKSGRDIFLILKSKKRRKKMKKFLSVLLSVCMVLMCSVSAFAYTIDSASKTTISDQEMAGSVGGCSGYASTVVTGYDGTTGVVNATFTNGLVQYVTNPPATTMYSLETINPATGAVTQILIPGQVAPAGTFNVNSTAACRGTAPSASCTARASLWSNSPGYCDAVKAQSVRLSN
jgi:hypothetical protein